MLELLRLLTQLRPRLRPLPNAPFALFAEWCIGQGLGPLVGHNLEYALPQLPAPRATKDKLLSVFQATLADNTLHLVNLRRAMQPLEGRKVVLFGTFSLAEALYPHVGFRPLLEVSMLVAEEDVEGFAGYMRTRGYAEEVSLPHAACGLSDGYTALGIFHRLPGIPHIPPRLQASPKRVFGPSVYSLSLADNLLALCARQYTEGYQGPWVDWVDMREACLLLAPAEGHKGPGADSVDMREACLLLAPAEGHKGPGVDSVDTREACPSSEVGAQSFKARAAEWGVAPAVYASLAVLERLFEAEVGAFQPEVPAAWAALAHRWADAYAALPEAVAAGRQETAQAEERRAFEAMASRTPPGPVELSATEGE
jgi:hypothetical protein